MTEIALDLKAAGEMLGLLPATARKYRRTNGWFPQPDETDEDGIPRWYPSTLTAWSATRPLANKGGRRGRPRKYPVSA